MKRDVGTHTHTCLHSDRMGTVNSRSAMRQTRPSPRVVYSHPVSITTSLDQSHAMDVTVMMEKKKKKKKKRKTTSLGVGVGSMREETTSW